MTSMPLVSILQVPAGWLKSVPDRGVISLHYCRERDTCRRVEAAFSAGAWPPDFHERHGVDWVQKNRLKIIKDKLRDKFASGRAAFKAMDRDGGGTMDRKELAVAVLQVGVWLHPSETSLLMDALDQDGSGEIEADEFEAFWNASIDLDEGLQLGGGGSSAAQSPMALSSRRRREEVTSPASASSDTPEPAEA